MRRFTGHDRFSLDYIDGKSWLVSDGFTYWLNADEFVTVPSGFITDFASIPRPLKILWPSPGGAWDLPAVVHDYLYRYAEVEHINGSMRTVNRAESDLVFRDGMDVQDVRETAEACLYRGVRIGGWNAWRKYRRQDSYREASHVEKAS